METVKLSSKYQVVVPSRVRKALGLKAGSKLRVYRQGQNIILQKSENSMLDELQGLGKEAWQSLGGADSYIKTERDSWGKR